MSEVPLFSGSCARIARLSLWLSLYLHCQAHYGSLYLQCQGSLYLQCQTDQSSSRLMYDQSLSAAGTRSGTPGT